MPHLTFYDTQLGPTIQVLIGLNSLEEKRRHDAKEAIAPAVAVTALIDTGAAGSCLDTTIIKQLGITPTGDGSMLTPSTGSTPSKCDQYTIGMAIMKNNIPYSLPMLPVLETDIVGHGIQMLIGRDVLRMCLLVYDGASGLFTLAF